MRNKKFDIASMGIRGVTKITGPSLGSVSNVIVQNSNFCIGRNMTGLIKNLKNREYFLCLLQFMPSIIQSYFLLS